MRIFIIWAIYALVLFAVVTIPVYSLNRLSCHIEWKDSNYKSRYGFLTGCQVNTDKGWVPADKVRLN